MYVHIGLCARNILVRFLKPRRNFGNHWHTKVEAWGISNARKNEAHFIFICNYIIAWGPKFLQKTCWQPGCTLFYPLMQVQHPTLPWNKFVVLQPMASQLSPNRSLKCFKNLAFVKICFGHRQLLSATEVLVGVKGAWWQRQCIIERGHIGQRHRWKFKIEKCSLHKRD